MPTTHPSTHPLQLCRTAYSCMPWRLVLTLPSGTPQVLRLEGLATLRALHALALDWSTYPHLAPDALAQVAAVVQPLLDAEAAAVAVAAIHRRQIQTHDGGTHG